MKPVYELLDNTPQIYSYPAHSQTTVPGSIFYRSYTFHYNWINLQENQLAHCDFSRHGFMELYEHRLFVNKSRRAYSFPLRSLKELSVHFRYFIIPMITGGIVAPLALVGIFNNIFASWTGLIMLFTGIMLFYYGYKGAYQVVIESHSTSLSFFVDEKSEELGQFVDLVNLRRGLLRTA